MVHEAGITVSPSERQDKRGGQRALLDVEPQQGGTCFLAVQATGGDEAAIGTVNKKELETLMTRGLDEEEAVDVIVQGMLEA